MYTSRQNCGSIKWIKIFFLKQCWLNESKKEQESEKDLLTNLCNKCIFNICIFNSKLTLFNVTQFPTLFFHYHFMHMIFNLQNISIIRKHIQWAVNYCSILSNCKFLYLGAGNPEFTLCFPLPFFFTLNNAFYNFLRKRC